MEKQRLRYNSKGKLIPSNFGIEHAGPGSWRCQGCRKVFSAHGDDLRGPYSWAVDGRRWEALNRARAQRHADHCDGKSDTFKWKRGDASGEWHLYVDGKRSPYGAAKGADDAWIDESGNREGCWEVEWIVTRNEENVSFHDTLREAKREAEREHDRHGS